jgi:hypothetical protein
MLYSFYELAMGVNAFLQNVINEKREQIMVP